jgi:subtilase family serine protease
MKQRAGLCLLVVIVVCTFVFSVTSFGQHRLQDRIARKIENTSTYVVKGNVHPLAIAGNDQGTVGESFRMEHVTMLFKPTDEQQAELSTLLEQQQDPSSPNYHHWLSPEEFADRFGLSENDVNKVVAWLKNQGFTVDEVGRNRSSVTFSGSARQIQAAFRTSIHRYSVNGKMYYANTTDPSVPAALADLVVGFRSLNNFRLKPKVVKRAVDAAASPQFTSSISGNHYLSPNDFTTIYDLSGLYSIGLDGTGQTIAVVGQTDIELSDIQAFRSASGLPANDPEVILVPGMSDPGISQGDLDEANMDLEWSGAVAPNAHIIYVNSTDAISSLQYAIDQKLAPVVSVSYGDCEKNVSAQDRGLLVSLGQQANAQGMTVLAASGDSGAADCEGGSARIATHGLSVDMPASLPYVTGMGGTEFNEAATLWSATNNASNGSALSYMPETTWNDTSNSGLSASGGGRSIYFSKPSWQTGTGVPNDSARDVPDVSISASPNHDGYLICSGGSCVNGYRTSTGTLTVVGGTSIGAPSFAGVVALINQKTGTSQGNINPILYSLAATAPAAFHDVTSGGNQVPCRAGSTDCTSTGVIGYVAGPGYDQTTGLGSVDVATLLASWPMPNTSTTQTSGANSSGSGSSGANSSGGATSTGSNQNTVPTPQPIPVVEQGAIRTGFMTITPDTNTPAPTPTVTFGIVSGGIVQSQAGVSPTPTITDGSFYANVIPGIGRNLGVAMVSSGSVTNTVTLTLRDVNGNTTGNPVTISLAPQHQLARFVNELFSSTVVGSSFLGSLRIQSSSPLGVLGLRFTGVEFSTLPVAVNSTSGPSTPLLLPQFAMGGGWATQLALVNNNGATISGRIDIFDASGNPMVVTLNGLTQSSFSYSVPAGGTFVLAPRDVNGQSPF